MYKLEGTGGYGPLLLATAEDLGALWAPYRVGVIYYGFFYMIFRMQEMQKK